MLLMSGLLYAVQQLQFAAIFVSLPDNLKIAVKDILIALYVLLPVTGWVAESWLGRYRAIVVGLIMFLVSILTLQAAFVMLQFDWTLIPVLTLLVISMLIGIFGFGSFFTIMLPFALDQMIGASAEQLGAAVHWFFWAFNTGVLLEFMLEYIPIPDQLQYLDILPVMLLTLATLCFSAVLIIERFRFTSTVNVNAKL